MATKSSAVDRGASLEEESHAAAEPSLRTGSGHQPARFYQPGLDVLRCMAFFLVFTSHVFPTGRTDSFTIRGAVQEFGSAGVCLFFTLSAFLITALLLREVEATGSVHMRAFYVRRILRIWPLYLSALVIGVIAPHFYHRFSPGGKLVLPYLFMCGNWALTLQGEAMNNPVLSPLWSISVEEQFYVLWPMLFLCWRRRGLITAMVFVLPLAWSTDYLLPALHYTVHTVLWYNSLSQFQFFALGGGLALWMHRRPFAPGLFRRLLAFAGAFVFLFLAAYPCHVQDRSGLSSPGQVLAGYLCIDVACLLLIFAFMNAKIFAPFKGFIYLGKISYGLYVFHLVILNAVTHAIIEAKWPLAVSTEIALNWFISALIVIPLASLSYEYFEKPFLRLKSRFTFVQTRSA